MKTPLSKRFTITLLLTIVLSNILWAQDQPEQAPEKKKKQFYPNNVIMFTPIYTAQFPYGDMQKRFGFNNLFGFQVGYKMKKNWIVFGEGSFLFGTKVKDNDVLDDISTASGQFITQSNEVINIQGQEIGFNFKVGFGKVIPFSPRYPDAGLLLMTGFGMLQHKIGINVRTTDLPELNKDYKTGYDRLCNGPVLSQFLGGIFMEKRRFLSFYAGVQFDVGFTENRRPYDFHLMQKLSEKRTDMFIGIRVGWILPKYTKSSAPGERIYF